MKDQLISLISEYRMKRALIIDNAYNDPSMRSVSDNFQAFKDELRFNAGSG